ncbi:MAG: hypothetical protein AAGF77_11290, partial [Bacteroidota bacterium]
MDSLRETTIHIIDLRIQKLPFIKLFIVSISLLVYGCIEDDTNVGCDADCSTLKLSFFSNEDEPLQGVKVNLNYRISNAGLGGSIRRIIEVESDENGIVNESFFIENDELGPAAKGFFTVDIDDAKLDVNRFIRTDNLVGNSKSDIGFSIFSISQRDTIIEKDYFFPRKTFITVNLNNFFPLSDSDNFEVRTLYPFGKRIGENSLIDTEFSTGFSGYDTFESRVKDTTFRVYVAGNEQNIIRIFRRKNEVNSSEDFPMFIPLDNDIELSF